LYLGVIFLGYLLLKALWVQLDIAGEFQHGAVSIFNDLLFIPRFMVVVRSFYPVY